MLRDKPNMFLYEGDESGNSGAGDSGQTVTPPEIDWTKVQIPDEVLKKDPRYAQVLDESIERRKTIANLKTMLEDKQPAPAPEKPNTQTTAGDEPEWARELREKLSRIETLETEKSLTALREGLAKAAGWSPEQARKLSGTTEEAVKAEIAEFETLFGKGRRFGGGTSNQDAETERKSRRTRLLEKINGANAGISESVFSDNFQDM